jgi:hypothetical protein
VRGRALENQICVTPIDFEEMKMLVQKPSFRVLFILAILPVFFVGCGGYATTSYNPAPAISSLSPASAIAGGAAFTLTVNGTGFVTGSNVQWNGSNRATTFLSATQLTASITAADIRTAGNAAVAVVNSTTGGTISSAANFAITSTLVSLVVSPIDPSIPRGTTQQFAATGTFTDGSSRDVTNSVVWGSSLPDVSSIDSAGLAAD